MSKIQQTQQTHSQNAVKANKPQQAHKSILNANTAQQMLDAPETMRAEDVLAAQQAVGNQVVQRALDKDDRRKGLTDPQGNLREDLNAQIQQKRGGGSPLPENLQKEASKKLGRSFKDVRIHTDEAADELSRTISARAFTIGKDIFFKNGVFAPGSSAGRETIIHELTHVVQQGGKGGASGALKLGAPDTAHEKEADRIGKKHAASIGTAPAGAVQREGEEDELMMQEDEEELQMQEDDDIAEDAPAESPEDLMMQEDEEELQMQEDDDIAEDAPAESPEDLMMQEDEEELQMQPAEEDELQMQPDAGNVIQREWEQDKNGKWKKKDQSVGQSAPKGKGKKPVVPPLNLSKLKPKAPEPPKGLPPVPKAVKSTVKAKAKFASLEEATSTEASEKRQEKIGLMEHDRDHQSKGRLKTEQKAGKMSFLGASVENKKNQEEAAKDPKQVAKQKWMATLKDPSASKEDIEKAKERLGTFHKDVGKKDFKAAKNERRSALEESAKSGDDEAYEKWQSERKKTKGEKAKGFFKSAGKKVGSGLLSAGKWAGKKGLGFAKGKLNEGVNHFLGIKDDDKDDDDDKAKAPSVNVTNNVGGGSGDSMSLVKELFAENKKLNEELASLKKTA
jgi:hypothetical protein